MKVLGEVVVAKFAARYAPSRKPLARFLEIARAARWPHFPAVKESFSAADYVQTSGEIIFDIAGNKYRLIAVVDFSEQTLLVRKVLTHEQYDRENL
jgi:mRNA interferase HigB